MLGAMAGHDPKDSTSVDLPVPDYAKAMTGDIRGMKIGVPKEYRLDGMAPEIEQLWHQGVEWPCRPGSRPAPAGRSARRHSAPG